MYIYSFNIASSEESCVTFDTVLLKTREGENKNILLHIIII